MQQPPEVGHEGRLVYRALKDVRSLRGPLAIISI